MARVKRACERRVHNACVCAGVGELYVDALITNNFFLLPTITVNASHHDGKSTELKCATQALYNVGKSYHFILNKIYKVLL